MTARRFPWDVLGIDATQDVAAIRKAYADVLRATDVDADIAGYATLRRARDHALWLAAQGARDEDEDEDEGEIYGLGALDDHGDAAGDDDDGWDEDRDDGAWDVAPGIQRPLPEPTPAPAPAPDPELTEAQARAQAAWDRLLQVLYPGGEASDEAVTHGELADGEAALAALIARADEADLAEHDALDSALAELFARTWPRSAPFVEPANAAFHWLDEAGALEERPALMFLNQRLKGMRFHDKVQLPDHPLHRAWKELSRPGRAGMFDRLRVKRLEVDKLLTGIRERYPELESFLDPERVASWEGQGSGGSDDGTGPRFVRGIVVVLLVVALLRLVSTCSAEPADTDPPPLSEAAAALSEAEVAVAVQRVFGPGLDMAGVRAADPVFAADLAKVIRTVGFASDQVLAFVRQKALRAATGAEFDGLVARGELKRMWLAATLDAPGQCRNVLEGDFESVPLVLAVDDAAREQKLLRRLLEAKALSGNAPRESETFSVPGWVVEATMKQGGLSDADLTAALRDPEHALRCKVELAMLGVILKEPGRVAPELLRAL